MVAAKKEVYVNKLQTLLDKYTKVMLVLVDNVGSKQIQSIRAQMRGTAEVIMGKNTMIRRVLRQAKNINKYGVLIPELAGNVGLIFTNEDLADVKTILETATVAAPAKTGAIAPVDVVVPAGDTGLEPTQTATLQRLNIATRINKGQIMILNDHTIIHKGDKVGASEAALLQKLKIMPFKYGLVPHVVYDAGAVFPASVLDLSQNDLITKLLAGVANIASVSLSIGLPTTASIRHSLSRGFKNVLAISIATEITFKQSEELKNLLDNPEALAALQATAAAAAAAPAEESKAAAEAAKEEEEEEEEEMGFSLFD